MQCTRCFGKRFVPADATGVGMVQDTVRFAGSARPCPACNGVGDTGCCDGDDYPDLDGDIAGLLAAALADVPDYREPLVHVTEQVGSWFHPEHSE